jgi:hypothetical protein
MNYYTQKVKSRDNFLNFVSYSLPQYLWSILKMNNHQMNKVSKYMYAIMVAILSVVMLNGCGTGHKSRISQDRKVLLQVKSSNTCIKNMTAAYVRELGAPIREQGFKKIEKVCKKVREFNAIHGLGFSVHAKNGINLHGALRTCYINRVHYMFHANNYKEIGPVYELFSDEKTPCEGSCLKSQVNTVFSNRGIKHYCNRKVRDEAKQEIVTKERNGLPSVTTPKIAGTKKSKNNY